MSAFKVRHFKIKLTYVNSTPIPKTGTFGNRKSAQGTGTITFHATQNSQTKQTSVIITFISFFATLLKISINYMRLATLRTSTKTLTLFLRLKFVGLS